jgi:RNA polymerase sigma-70 factor, ECF subfamily
VTDHSVNKGGGSAPTSTSLLERVQAKDQAAWERLVHLYSTLVYRWCRQAGLQEADAADVGQEVFQAVYRGIAKFHRDRAGDSFRGWLHAITRNKLRDFARHHRAEECGAGGSEAQTRLQQVEDDSPANAGDATDQDDKLTVYRRAVELILADYEERTRQAFWRVMVEQQRPADVARDLGMTTNAVYLAKSRILRRIRDEFAGLEEL